MTFMGIDYHKKYSVVTILDQEGQKTFQDKVPNTQEAFQHLLKSLPAPVRAVIEASRTWHVMYDLLDDLGVEVWVAHPTQLRAIAQAQIKTDARDSDILAYLLRANLIPRIHVPDRQTRRIRYLIRQRLSLVQLRTRVKNRTHHLLDRNHIPDPGLTDLFGKAGRRYLDSLALVSTEQLLLERLLAHLDFLESQIKELDSLIQDQLKEHPNMIYLKSIPGIGKTLAAVIALEVDSINRFATPKHFASYAGLVPSTYASGGTSYQGHLLQACNRLLKWAFIEAAWKALISSAYCRAYFQKIRRRLGPNPAVVALARRLAHIAYALLKEQRLYQERPFCPSRPQVKLA